MNDNLQSTNNPLRPVLELPNNDPGYFYDPKVEAGTHGEIKLSPRVESHCKCGGLPPYQVFESPHAEPTWCVCRHYRMHIRKVNRLISQSGIPERFRYHFLDQFQETYKGNEISGAARLKEHLRPLIYRCTEARRSDKTVGANSPARGFLLWGKPGNGKTMFCCVALNELIFHSGLAGKFIGLSRKFFQTLRHTFDEDSPIHGQAIPIMESLSSIPFLVIDDLGVQRDTEWEVEMLYNLVDARYAEQRLTFITTNRSIDEIKGLADGRIYSRFLEMCHLIHVQAPDYREYSKREYEI
jgi:DNA replication protein DnaC